MECSVCITFTLEDVDQSASDTFGERLTNQRQDKQSDVSRVWLSRSRRSLGYGPEFGQLFQFIASS